MAAADKVLEEFNPTRGSTCQLCPPPPLGNKVQKYKNTKIQKYNKKVQQKIQKYKKKNMKIKRSTRHQAMLRREKGPWIHHEHAPVQCDESYLLHKME